MLRLQTRLYTVSASSVSPFEECAKTRPIYQNIIATCAQMLVNEKLERPTIGVLAVPRTTPAKLLGGLLLDCQERRKYHEWMSCSLTSTISALILREYLRLDA